MWETIKRKEMKAGKLLRISDDRSIYIIENEDGSLISPEGIMRYRNIGAGFAIEVINQDQVMVDEKGMADVGGIFHFPVQWLNTDGMSIQRLVEKGLLKLS